MSIRKKTILILAVSFTALVSVSSLLLYLVVSGKFKALELVDVHNSVDRVVNELEDSTERLTSTATDWGRWDDTWFFVKGKNPAYIEENLDLDSLYNLQVEFIIVADSGGVAKVAREVDLEVKTIGQLDGRLTGAILKQLGSSTRAYTVARSGYMVVEGKALIYGGQPILRNDGSGPSAGYLVFGRFLDQAFIDKISKKLNYRVMLKSFADPEVSRILSRGSTSSFHDVSIIASPLDSSTIQGASILADTQGSPLLLVVVELRRSINEMGNSAVINGVAALSTMGALFSLLVILLIDRTVLSRLSAMTDALKKNSGRSVTFDEKAADEIGLLARTVEKGFEDLARSNEQIRLSERQKELALAGADLGFWEYNLSSGRVFYSGRFCSMLGYGPDELAPTLETLLSLVHEEDRPHLEEEIRQAVAHAGAGWETEYRVRRKDGGYAFVNSRGRVVDTDGSGAPLLLYGTHLDVTERVGEARAKKKLEEQLATAQKMKAIATLAGGVAHNFNNILAVIIGYTELVMEDLERNSQPWKNAKEVIVASSRASDLVRQLLIFSKEREQMRETLDIRRIVSETFRFMREVIPTSIEMIQTMPETPALVTCDSFMIRQAFINICTNALEAFEGEEGRIIITVSYERDAHLAGNLDEGDLVRIIFSDNGSGMDPQTLAFAFDPYFTTRDTAEKAGLGLSLVHGAVTGCGGTVEIKSAPGVGTTVIVTLPAKVGALAEEAVTHGNLAGHERIIFIDDEKLLVDIARQYFGRLGYLIEATDSANDGLALILSDPNGWDVVITDMTMPGLNGAELAARAHQARPDLPVFLCSGYIDVLTEQQKLDAGIARVFKKPVSFDDLAWAIRSLFDG